MEEKKADIEKFRIYEDIIPDFASFMEIIKTPQPYWLRVNTLKIKQQELVNRLQSKGFVLERYENMNAYKIAKMPVKHPGATMEHSLGYYYIQDLSSMAPVWVLSPIPGENILDMAAAPGSKSTMMAEMMENRGTIIANDINYNRLKSLAANIERLGITNIIVTNKDAQTAKWGKFKKILLDAPCSGEGTFRKNPWDFRFATDKERAMLVKQQKKMVENAWNNLEDEGILVYSTCTYHPLENENVVKYAVEKLNMEVISVEVPVPHAHGVMEWKNEEFSFYRKCVRIYPHLMDAGGMFIAVLKKR